MKGDKIIAHESLAAADQATVDAFAEKYAVKTNRHSDLISLELMQNLLRSTPFASKMAGRL